MAVTYKSESYHPGRAFGYGFPVFLSLVALLVWVGRIIESDSFLIVGWILLCTIPFLFQQKYRRLFAHQAVLKVDEQSLSIIEYSLRHGDQLSEFTANWHDLVAYKFFYTSSQTCLTFYRRGKRTKSYIFNDNPIQDEKFKSDSLLRIIYTYIKQYNIGVPEDRQIMARPKFMATWIGGALLAATTLLLIVDIAVHIRNHSQSWGLLVMGASMLMSAYLKRLDDKAVYKRVQNM